MKRLVLLHGFTGSPQSFRSVLSAGGPELPAWEETFCPFLAGHGNPPNLSTQNFESELSRLERLIVKCCAVPVPLVGYSMGARLALGLVVRLPRLFSGVTLIGVNPGLPSDGAIRERAEWEGQWIRLLEECGVAEFERRWSSQTLFSGQESLPPESTRQQKSIRLSHGKEGLAHALRVLGLSSMPNFWTDLPSIRTPLWLVCGERDTKFVEIARVVAGSAPDAHLEVVAGVGHNVLLEAPSAVGRLIAGQHFRSLGS